MSKSVKLDVRFYNNSHKTALLKTRYGAELDAVTTAGISISPEALFAYAMFTEQRDYDGRRTANELKSFAASRFAEYEQNLSFTNGRLRFIFPTKEAPAGFTERLGVACSLATIGHALHLTEADWTRIGISTEKKSLDFRTASTGSHFIELESKGSLVESTVALAELSHHATHVKQKKAAQLQHGSNQNSTLLATIAAIPVLGGAGDATVNLLDPPSSILDSEPSFFKTIARLRFYRSVLTALGDRHFAIALAERISVLTALGSEARLSGRPLVGELGEPIRPGLGRIRRNPLGRSEPHSRLFEASDGTLLYLGLELEASSRVAGQDFRRIREYRATNANTRESIESEVEVDPPDALVATMRERRWSDARRRFTPRPLFRGFASIATLGSGLVFGAVRKARWEPPPPPPRVSED